MIVTIKMQPWETYAEKHLNIKFLTENERQRELESHIKLKSGWPDEQYMKDSKGKYVKHITYDLIENLNDVTQIEPEANFEWYPLPKLSTMEKWMLVRIAVASCCTFNKHVLCRHVHKIQLWHQMIVRVCNSLSDLSHIDNSNLNDATKSLIRSWKQSPVIPIYFESDHIQPRTKSTEGWKVKKCMVPIYSELEALFHILLERYKQHILQFVANAIHSKAPKPRLSLYSCSEICRNDMVLSRITNAAPKHKHIKIDAEIRNPEETVQITPATMKEVDVQKMTYKKMLSIAKRQKIAADCNEECLRQKVKNTLQTPYVLLWGKQKMASDLVEPNEANYLLCKVSVSVFHKNVDGVDLSNLIQRNPIKTKNASLNALIQTENDSDNEKANLIKELIKTENDSLDNKVAFGDTAHIEMKSQHLILKTAIAHCFRISVTTLYDAMQQTAALDKKTNAHEHSSITAGPFPNERNYAGHAFLFDVVVLPNNYDGHQFQKYDHWMAGIDLYSRMLFACKSQGTTGQQMAAALAKCLNKMNCTKFKLENATKTNTTRPVKTVSADVCFRDMHDRFVPLGTDIKSIDTKVFGLTSFGEKYAHICDEHDIIMTGNTKHPPHHIPPGYALEELICRSYDPTGIEFTRTEHFKLDASEARDQPIRQADFIDELYNTLIKFKSKNKHFQNQYSEVRKKLDEILPDIMLPRSEMSESEIYLKLQQLEDSAIEKVTVQQLMNVLSSQLDYLEDKLKDNAIPREMLLLLKEKLFKIERKRACVWDDVRSALAGSMKIDIGTEKVQNSVKLLKQLTFRKTIDIASIFGNEADTTELAGIISKLKGVDPDYVDTVFQVEEAEIWFRKNIKKEQALSSSDIPNMCTYVFSDSSTTDFGHQSTEVIVKAGYKHVIINKSSVDDETHRSNPLIMSPIESQFKQIRLMQLLMLKQDTIFNRNGGDVEYSYDPQDFTVFGNSGYFPDSQMKMKKSHHISTSDLQKMIRTRNEGQYKVTGHAPVDLWKKTNFYNPEFNENYVDFTDYPPGTVVDIKLVGEQDQGNHPANRRVSQLAIVKHNKYSMELAAPLRLDSGILKFDILARRQIYPNSMPKDIMIANVSVTPSQIEKVIVQHVITSNMKGSGMKLVDRILHVYNRGWNRLNAQWLLSPVLPTIGEEENATITEVKHNYFIVKAGSKTHVLENPPLNKKQVTGASERPRWKSQKVV